MQSHEVQRYPSFSVDGSNSIDEIGNDLLDRSGNQSHVKGRQSKSILMPRLNQAFNIQSADVLLEVSSDDEPDDPISQDQQLHLSMGLSIPEMQMHRHNLIQLNSMHHLQQHPHYQQLQQYMKNDILRAENIDNQVSPRLRESEVHNDHYITQPRQMILNDSMIHHEVEGQHFVDLMQDHLGNQNIRHEDITIANMYPDIQSTNLSQHQLEDISTILDYERSYMDAIIEIEKERAERKKLLDSLQIQKDQVFLQFVQEHLDARTNMIRTAQIIAAKLAALHS